MTMLAAFRGQQRLARRLSSGLPNYVEGAAGVERCLLYVALLEIRVGLFDGMIPPQ